MNTQLSLSPQQGLVGLREWPSSMHEMHGFKQLSWHICKSSYQCINHYDCVTELFSITYDNCEQLCVVGISAISAKVKHTAAWRRRAALVHARKKIFSGLLNYGPFAPFGHLMIISHSKRLVPLNYLKNMHWNWSGWECSHIRTGMHFVLFFKFLFCLDALLWSNKCVYNRHLTMLWTDVNLQKR